MADDKLVAGPTISAPRHIFKRWLWAILSIFTFFVIATAMLIATVQTELGARAVWSIVSVVKGGHLGGTLTGGTLAHGLHWRNLYYQDEKRKITISHIDAKWDLSLASSKLTVHRLALGQVTLDLLPTPPEPLELPVQLTLPLAVDLKQATLEKLVVKSESARFEFSDIRLHASTDKVNHRLILERATTPIGHADLNIGLNGKRPFLLQGTADLAGQARDENYTAKAQLSGSLQRLIAEMDIAGTKLAGTGRIIATPFSAMPFENLRVNISRLNLTTFNANALRSDISIVANLTPIGSYMPGNLAAIAVSGPIAIRNKIPGSLDRGLLPITSIIGIGRLDAKAQRLSDLRITLADSSMLTGSAHNRSPFKGTLDLQAHGLNLKTLHDALQPTRLSGPVVLDFDRTRQQLRINLADSAYSVEAAADIDNSRILLKSAQLQSGQAQLKLSGSLARNTESAYQLKGALNDFNPALFINVMELNNSDFKSLKKSIQARINSDFSISGQLKPERTAKVVFDIHDSLYGQLPMSGGGIVQVAGKQVLDSNAKLDIAGNHASVKGAFGAPGDKLDLHVDAPSLDKLGFGLSGLLKGDGQFAGTLREPKVNATYHAERLKLGQHRLAEASGQVQLSGLPAENSNATLKFDLDAQGYNGNMAQLDKLRASITGTYANHRIQLASSGKVHGEKIDMALVAHGRLHQATGGMAWIGMVDSLENRSVPHIHLEKPASISAAQDQLTVGAASINIEQAQLTLKNFAYEAGTISSAGEFNTLNVAHLLTLRRELTGADSPVQTDLVLDARWNFKLARQGNGFAQVERRSGDVSIPDTAGNIMLGLNKLQMRADLKGTALNFNAQADADRIGNMQANGSITLQSSGPLLAITPQAPVSAHVLISIPQLSKAGAFAGPRVSLDGSFKLDLMAEGTLDAAQWSGNINGNNLSLMLYDQGVRLRDGIARMVLRNNVLEMQKVELYGGKGVLRIVGSIPIDRQRPELTATVLAERLQLLADPASQLTISGQAKVTNLTRLAINGKFTVDSALFSLPETPAPKLDDDVVVIRRSGSKPNAVAVKQEVALAKKPANPYTPSINIDIDLGKNFRFIGQGANLLLTGLVNIQSKPQQQPAAQGTVNVTEGTFEAFGTKLAIEHGIINFKGPFDNPNINILAMRRNQEVAAGVQVTGTASRPLVTLISEPDVSNEQKLSWLVFGHASGGNEQGGQAQAAAQGAALALANALVGGRNVAKKIGLDEISLGTGASGQQLLSLGKTISDRLSLGYKQGLTSTESAIELTYLISQHWSVVTRGGRILGLNIFYSKRFDAIRGDRTNAVPAPAK